MAEYSSAPVSWLQMTRTVVSARLRAQLSYRASFLADLFNQMLLIATEYLEVYVLLHNAPVFGGMDLAQATVVYGLSGLAFGLADMIFGQLDTVDNLIRTGQLDSLLVRPTSVLFQLISTDVQLRRLGRAGMGLVIYLLALGWAEIAWTPAKVALAVLAPIAGVGIFGAMFLASGSLLFWVIDGGQAGNTLTYGGRYVSSVPGAALFTPVRVFFTFVVPATLVAYVPTAVLTNAPLPSFLWPWMAWAGLPVALLCWLVVLRIWRAAINHYAGAGG